MTPLDLAFWFHIRPPLMSLLVAGAAAVVFLILLIVGVVAFGRAANIGNRHRAGAWTRLGSWGIIWAVLGFVWIFLAYERINFFGARFWLLIGGLLAFVWLGSIIWYAKKTIPALDTAARERATFEKYLPRRRQ